MNAYLKNNSMVREELINYKLVYELKKAAAHRNYHLKTYLAAVDIEGYDVIIDDSMLLRKVQVKSKFDSVTPRWEVHKSMLLPDFALHQDYGFDSTICPSTPGCIFLIEAKTNGDDINFEYYFTDIDVLTLMDLGILRTSPQSNANASKILKELRSGKCFGKTTLNKGLFLKLKDAESLLSIAGFQSRGQQFIHYNIWQIMKAYYRPRPEIQSLEKRLNEMTGHFPGVRDKLSALLHPKFRYKLFPPKDLFGYWLKQ